MATSWADPLLYCNQPWPCVTPHVWGGHTCAWGDTRVPEGTWAAPKPPPNPLCRNAAMNPTVPRLETHLEEGDDKGAQREVGGLLELGVKLLDGEGGVLWGQPGLSTPGTAPCTPGGR